MITKGQEVVGKILGEYYKNGNLSSLETRRQLVRDLQIAYDSLDRKDKVDVLIPAHAEFLIDGDCIRFSHNQSAYDEEFIPIFSIRYDWETQKWENGFRGDSHEYKTTSPRMVDRIGGPEGTFVCTIPENRAPYSKYERSIPYYIPEDDITRSPSYHIYRIKGRIEGARIGESAPLFWDKRGIKCGGAEQIKFPKTIESMDLKNVEEIER